jgi:hypothetical protein
LPSAFAVHRRLIDRRFYPQHGFRLPIEYRYTNAKFVGFGNHGTVLGPTLDGIAYRPVDTADLVYANLLNT